MEAQFPIGKYLKQLDRFYSHPNYRTDFLIIYTEPNGSQSKIIVEYDGFKEHFTDLEHVNEVNFSEYYKAEDVEREKVLESYGYKFIRINRFNVGDDPVKTLNGRLMATVKKRPTQKPRFTALIHEDVSRFQEGDIKVCPRCGEAKELTEFLDPVLVSGEGRICKPCKRKSRSRPKRKKSAPENVKPGGVPSCPSCGSRMALRSGRFGRFFGCTSYPRCRGTRRYQ